MAMRTVVALETPRPSSERIKFVMFGSMWRQVVLQFLTEVILCVKEVNKKTRAAAFDLLVKLAHAMEEASPAPNLLDMDTCMGTAFLTTHLKM
jgi:hypothetical protein